MAEHSNTLVTVKSNSSLQTETEAQSDATDEEQNEKAFWPTLICESTVRRIPPNLQKIIENLDSYGGSESNKNDLLISALYVLMIETGFIPKQYKDMFDDTNIDFHVGRLQSLAILPERWKFPENNSYKLEFILQPIPDRVCKLTCVIINQNLTANLIVRPLGKFCIQLVVNRYITKEDLLPVPRKFQNLTELSIDFKNQIALAAKNAVLTVESIPHASLLELPTEIVYKIFFQQQAVDFVNLKTSCRRMQECATFFEHDLWQHYFKRDFPNSMTTSSENWAGKYKEEFKIRLMRKKREEAVRRGVKRKPFLIYNII